MKGIKSYLLPAGLVCLILALAGACTPVAIASPMPIPPTVTAEDSINGTVVDTDGKPVPGAIVRIQTTTNETRTDKNGNYILSGLEAGIPVTVSAWKQDHYCELVEKVIPPASDVTLTLRPYQTNDNPAYEWLPHALSKLKGDPTECAQE